MQADAPEGSGWLVAVKLSNGRTIEADFVISAVGVTPNTQWLGQTLALHPTDRGIHVNRQ
jgi:pyruvate/2-oxoglutarate dehydrogenase complex dihydrolipoamide dehydrogenase (E3) component